VTAVPHGPKGKPRPIALSIILAFLTLGIFTLFWTYRTHQEIKAYSGAGLGGPIGLLIYVFLTPATGFLLAGEVRTMCDTYDRPCRVSALTGLWLLLPLIGALVWFDRVQGDLNGFWATAP
jgi:hypothetical protein